MARRRAASGRNPQLPGLQQHKAGKAPFGALAVITDDDDVGHTVDLCRTQAFCPLEVLQAGNRYPARR